MSMTCQFVKVGRALGLSMLSSSPFDAGNIDGGDATAVAEEVGVGRRRRRVCDHHRLLEEAEVREGHPHRFVPGEQEQASHDGEAHRAGELKDWAEYWLVGPPVQHLHQVRRAAYRRAPEDKRGLQVRPIRPYRSFTTVLARLIVLTV